MLLSGCSHHRSGGILPRAPISVSCSPGFRLLASWFVPSDDGIKPESQETAFALEWNSVVTHPGVDRSWFHFQKSRDFFQRQVDRQFLRLFGIYVLLFERERRLLWRT